MTIRFASKKSSSSTRNPKNDGRPHHRGWKVQDGAYVSQGTLLVTQLTPRFHPGLNVSCCQVNTKSTTKNHTYFFYRLALDEMEHYLQWNMVVFM